MDNRLQRLSKQAGQRALIARLFGPVAGLAGLGILLVYLFQSGFFSMLVPIQHAQPYSAPATKEISGTDALINGYDKNGLPYVITANRATQDTNDTKLVHLAEPRGAFTRSSGKKIDLSGESARYNTETKLLNLEGDVVFEQLGSYKANMAKADLDLNDLSLSSKSAVHVEMDSGVVDADHLEISDNGKKTLFSGHVKANLKSDIESGIVP